MYQELSLSEIKALSLADAIAYKAKVEAAKSSLAKAKEKGSITKEQQEQLDNAVMHLVDVEAIIEEMQQKAYKPAAGTEDLVHLMIVRGRRYNPMTGKEESSPYKQVFTLGEWQLFKANYKGLGFTILKVLHDPFGDAVADAK